MLIEKVRKLKPVERMLYFIQEREKVRLAKESGKPKPWTDDVILQSYRFCNIRRADDKVSRWLINNWYKPNFNHKNILLAVALARFINKPESLSVIGFPDKWYPGRLLSRLREYRDDGNTVFNGAYMVRGNDGIDKLDCVINHYVQPLTKRKDWINTDSMEQSHSQLCLSYGFGSFMAGQVVADLRWAREGKWNDRMDWAPIGPGSRRGMNRLLGLDIKYPMTQYIFQGHLSEFIQTCEDNLPKSITSRMEAMDYQNCCCEFDGYERALHGGRKKQNYPGK